MKTFSSVIFGSVIFGSLITFILLQTAGTTPAVDELLFDGIGSFSLADGYLVTEM